MKTTIILACLALMLGGTASAQLYVGPVDNTIGAGANYTFMGDGLTFDVLQPTTIISVDVYPNGPGPVVVNLLDNLGVAIPGFTTTFNYTGPGAGAIVTVPLGFNNIPVGTGYRLDANGTATGGLYRNSSGATFPYTAPGQLSIINAITGNGFYYFFYNWCIATPAPPPYPGTMGGDLNLASGVNGVPSGFPFVKSATAFDAISLKVDSPMGTYDYQPFLLLAQPFNTGFPPTPTLPGLGVWLDLSVPFVILIDLDPFLTQFLNPGGTTYTFIMPPGFTNQSFLFQGAAVTPALSITNGFEIQVM